MPTITAPTGLYDALLALADAQETQQIKATGNPPNIVGAPMFRESPEWTALEAIRAILSRIAHDPALRLVASDPRTNPPTRATIDRKIYCTADVAWDGYPFHEPYLLLHWVTPPLRLNDVEIEPVPQPAFPLPTYPVPTLGRSPRLKPGERHDDTMRIVLMQERITEKGWTPTTAARDVAREMPAKPTSEDSLTRRLVRKWTSRQENQRSTP